MPPILYRRLLPDARDAIDARSLLDEIALTRPDAPADRPYTIVNFVESVDGRVTIDGRSAGLGGDSDRELFRELRERADAVLAGTATMAAERYGRLLRHPESRQRRIAAGRPAEPLACLISFSGRLPLEIPLFAEPEARVVVFSPSKPDLTGIAAHVHHEPLAQTDRPLAAALAVLRSRHGVQTLLCEGGPTLFAALLAERLVDELYLTLAPKLTGAAGAGHLVGSHPTGTQAGLTLLTVLEHDGALHLRYRMR